jgi:hypothetical protein
MKAIETIYDNHRFRSRLEARWGVFFKTLGILYEYEKEGFDLEGGIRYLPDFWLPKQKCWIEIKGQHATEIERRKACLLAIATNHPVYIFAGDIGTSIIDEGEPFVMPATGDVEGYYHNMEKDGALGCDPAYAIIRGIDTSSPCYTGSCSHPYDKCPYRHEIHCIGNEAELVRALYTDEILADHGSTYHEPIYKLALTSNNDLICFHENDAHEIVNVLPIPQCVQKNYDEFVSFFKRFSPDWHWGIGGTAATVEPQGPFKWCECSTCGKYNIVFDGTEWHMPCHQVIRPNHDYILSPDGSETKNLMNAYITARQARFEFGETPN